MLIVIVGGEGATRAKTRHKYVKSGLEELAPDFSMDELASLAGTPALFGGARSLFLRNALSGKGEEERSAERAEELLAMAKGLADSPHLFIIEEEKLLAKPLEKLKKAGATIETLEAPKKKQEFNVFAIGDALARGDRKNLWLLLTKALRSGLAPENIAGVLAWKARTMCASARSSAEKQKFEKLSRDLVVMYHESHRGAGDLGLLLERFALTV